MSDPQETSAKSSAGQTPLRSRLASYWRYARRHPVPIWAGISVVGALHLRRKWREAHSGEPDPAVVRDDTVSVALYKLLPLRTFSRLWGRANDLELPSFLRSPLLGVYVRVFGCQMDEAVETSLSAYRNLGELFRRPLKPGARPVNRCPKAVCAPCDGEILVTGTVTPDGLMDQVKGVQYSLSHFLGSEYGSQVLPKPKEGYSLFYVVIYLAPGDYHRFHSPVEWRVANRKHFPGYLLSVNPVMAARVAGLFAINERVVYQGQWKHGFFSMSAIGATNVGSMRFSIDPELNTNRPGEGCSTACHERTDFGETWLDRGSEFGEFNLGSTIVLIFEAPSDSSFSVGPGDVTRVGRRIFKCER